MSIYRPNAVREIEMFGVACKALFGHQRKPSEMKHFVRKLWSTVRITTNLAMARTFGEYAHSVRGAVDFEYAVYRWRGQEWAIPTTPHTSTEQRSDG